MYNIYIYVYIHTYMYTYIHVFIYIHVYLDSDDVGAHVPQPRRCHGRQAERRAEHGLNLIAGRQHNRANRRGRVKLSNKQTEHCRINKHNTKKCV